MCSVHWLSMNLENRLRAAEHAVTVLRKLIAEQGPITVHEKQVFAGTMLLNGDASIVDATYEQTLFSSTIFHGNVRIATRAVAQGESERAIGTRANDEVTRQVFEKGEVFRGRTTTLGKEWVIVYVPFHAANGQRIGMLAAYRELAPSRARV